MRPGDLVFWRDPTGGRNHHLWEIKGVYLGCLGQEGLVELQNLFESPGVPGMTGGKTTTFVPEALIRNMIYSFPRNSDA